MSDDSTSNRSRIQGRLVMAAGLVIVLSAGIWTVLNLARSFGARLPFISPHVDTFGSLSKVFLPGIMPIFIGVVVFFVGRNAYMRTKNDVREGSLLDTGPAGMLTWFFGGLLMGAGMLIMLTAGVCSFAVLTDVVTFNTSNYVVTTIGMVLIILIFAGLPIGFGAALFFVARAIYRSTWNRL